MCHVRNRAITTLPRPPTRKTAKTGSSKKGKRQSDSDNNNNSSKGSSVLAVRLSKPVKEKLDIESAMSGVTLNPLVNQILTKHAEWDRFAKDAGFASITKAFLRSVLEQLDDKTITTIAVTTCRGAMRAAMIYMSGKLNYANFTKTLDLWLDAANVPYRHLLNEDGEDMYIVQHQLGQKWSVYFATVVNSVLNEIGYRTNEQSIMSDSVTFTIVKAAADRRA